MIETIEAIIGLSIGVGIGIVIGIEPVTQLFKLKGGESHD